MAIPQEVTDTITYYKGQGQSSTQIFDKLKASGKFPEISDTITYYRGQKMSDDNILAKMTGAQPGGMPTESEVSRPSGIWQKVQAGLHPAQTPEARKTMMAGAENYPKVNAQLGTVAPLIGAMAPGPLSIPGYVAGKKLSNVANEMTGTKPTTVGQEIKSLPKDIGEGILQYAGGKVLDWFAGKAAPYLESIAEKIYASAAKMPLSKKWIATTPFKELSDRQIATRLALEKRIPISEKGLQMAKNAEEETRSIIDGIIDTGSAAGDVVNKDALYKGLDNAYFRAASSSDPRGAVRMIDSIAKKFDKRPKMITTQDLQAIKRQMYKEASDYAGKFKSFHDEAHKGLAHEAMSTLERFYPQLTRLNARDAAYIKLVEALQRATSRESNKYAFGLTEGVGAAAGGIYGGVRGKNVKSAGEGVAAGIVFTKLMRDPWVLSQLSFALARATKLPARELFEKALSIQAAQAISGKIQPEQPAKTSDVISRPTTAEPRADGGPVKPGQPYLVGEKGPEVIVPDQPGTVIPTDQALPHDRKRGETLKSWATRLHGMISSGGRENWRDYLNNPGPPIQGAYGVY